MAQGSQSQQAGESTAEQERDLFVAAAYRDHGAAVRCAAAWVCGPALADDVTQEVFVQLWRLPKGFDPGRGSLRTYLVLMARRRAVDAVRSYTRRRAREERIDRSTGSAGFASTEHEALSGIDSQVIIGAVRLLPAGERDALILAFFGECTYRETARLLGEAEGTVKSRIRSGLRRLAWMLQEEARPGQITAVRLATLRVQGAPGERTPGTVPLGGSSPER